MFNKKYFVIISAILSGIFTFMVYIPAINNGFVNWDDNLYVYGNTLIRDLDVPFMARVFTSGEVMNWHPLTMISLAIDYSIWGLDPWGYHLVNIIVHSINTLLVFILVVRLLEAREGRTPADLKGVLLVGSVTALLFGIHPVHVESVAWISERKDVLFLFFYLLSIIVYIEYTNSYKKSYGKYLLALFIFLLSIMSKPMAVSLPVILLILDFYPLNRIGSFRDMWEKKYLLVEKVPFFLISLFSVVVTLWVQNESGAMKSLEKFPLVSRLCVAAKALIFYLYKMIYPVELAPYYPHPHNVDFFSYEYLGAFMVIAVITYYAFVKLKKNRLYAALWSSYVITLLPVLGVVQAGEQAAADRYTYLPAIAPFLLAGLGLRSLICRHAGRQSRYWIAVFMIILLLSLTAKTVDQISIWHDGISLWSHQIKADPTTYKAYINRGQAYSDAGRYDLAMRDYGRAEKIKKGDPRLYNNRAIVYFYTGRYKDAMRDYNRSLEIDPEFAETYYNRGSLSQNMGKYGAALADFNKAIEMDPKFVKVHNNKGNIYNILGDLREAIRNYDLAIGLDKKYQKAYLNRGVAYLKEAGYSLALNDFNMAIRLDPNDSNAFYLRGKLFYATKDYPNAIDDFNRSLLIRPEEGKVFHCLGLTYSAMGNDNFAQLNHRKAAGLGIAESAALLSEGRDRT